MNHVQIDADKAKDWLSKGVQPSDTVHNILVGQKVIEAPKKNVLPKKSPIVDEEAIKRAEEESAAKAAAEAEAAAAAEAPADEATEAPTEEAAAEEAPVEETPAEAAPEAEIEEEKKD